MRDFPLCLVSARTFALFKAANTAPMRPGARRPVAPSVEENELDTIFKRFNITDDAIGAASSFGKVYRGSYNGFPVAIKVEKKGTESKEFSVLQRIQELRRDAPADVQAHLPFIFAIDGAGNLNYYIMELLVPAPASVLDDVFGGSYSANVDYGHRIVPHLERQKGESDADYSARNSQHIESATRSLVSDAGANPAELNMEAGIVLLHSDRERWADQALIDAAFDIWYANRAELFWEIAGDPGADDSDFRKEIKRLISSAVWKLLGSGRDIAIPADRLSTDIGDEVAGGLSDSVWLTVWEELRHSLPELLFAISRASWLAVWHPSNPLGSDYAKLRRTPGSHNLEYREALQSTLDWLADHGLAWGDVHSGNIMMRPNTRELVFIDFGLYSFITSR